MAKPFLWRCAFIPSPGDEDVNGNSAAADWLSYPKDRPCFMIARPMPRLSIAQTFEALRAKKQIALMPFVPAGYPSLEATEAILPALEAGGANLIEIGVPFSDPIADGPVIQAAFTESLANHIKVANVF